MSKKKIYKARCFGCGASVFDSVPFKEWEYAICHECQNNNNYPNHGSKHFAPSYAEICMELEEDVDEDDIFYYFYGHFKY